MSELERHGSFPRALDVSLYAAARLRELWHLQHLVGANRRPDAIGSASGSGRSSRRIFQLLPWHVRRRTMSFTARRVPRRWRLRAEAELARQPQANRCRAPSKHRRRTRRYYRKSSWLLADRSEPESRYGWLETHIWHARRMHMFEPCWGGRLAWAPCDRGLASFWRCACRGRSSIAWRLASDVCALYDASWYRVIEVPGDLAPHILPPLIGGEAWARLCSEPVFRGLKRLVGTRIRDETGNLVAAEVEWLWEPLPLAATEDLVHGKEESDEGSRETAQSFARRRLWAFVHPLSKEAVLALMIRSAKVSKSPDPTHSEAMECLPDSSAVEAHQNVGIGDEECSAASLSVSADRASDAKPIETPRVLTDGLIRFEFYGVRSTETLYRVLRNARADGRDWAEFSHMAMQTTSTDAVPSQRAFHLDCADPRLFYPPRTRVPGRRRSQTQLDHNYSAFAAYWQSSAHGPGPASTGHRPRPNLSTRTLFDPELRQTVSAMGRHPAGIVSARIRRWRRHLRHIQAALQQIRHDFRGTGNQTSPDGASVLSREPPRKRHKQNDATSAVDGAFPEQSGLQNQDNSTSDLVTNDVGNSSNVRIPLILLHRPARSRRRWDCGWDVLLPRRWAMAFWNSFCYAGARGVGLRERRFLYHESGRGHFPEDFPECREAYRCWAQFEIQIASERWSRRPPSKRVNFVIYRAPEPFGVVDWLETALSLQKHSADSEEASATKLVVIRSREDLTEYNTQRANMQHSISFISSVRYLVRVRLRPCGRASLDTNALICSADTSEEYLGGTNDQTAAGHRQPVKPLEEPRGNVHDHLPTRPVIGRVTSSHYSWSDGCIRAYGFVLASALCGRIGDARDSPSWSLQRSALVRDVTSLVYREVRLEPVLDDHP